MPERLVVFEACFNFRDLGGYPTADGRTVRWGRLFRSDSLHRLTDTDVEHFRGLGLRTVIDLRGSHELEHHGALRSDARHDLAWRNHSLIDDVVLEPGQPVGAPEDAPGERYLSYVTGPAAVDVFRALTADNALPAAFHCTSGKDRTGVIAALVLELLGVPDDVIADDYRLTAESMPRAEAWIAEHEPAFAAFIAQLDAERRLPKPERILGFLSMLRADHGSAEQLLLGLGIEPAAIERLRDELLDD